MSGVNLFPHGVIVFRTADGRQIARFSTEPSERGAPGDNTISERLKALIRERRDHTLYDAVSPRPRRPPLRIPEGQQHALLFAGRTAEGRSGPILASSGHRARRALPWSDTAALWIARRLHRSAAFLEERSLLRQRVAERTRGRSEEPRPRRERGPGGSRQQGEVRVSRQHQPRDPHAPQRHHGHDPVLARSALDAEQAGYVRKLDSAGGNMLVLLTDVLDLSKIEAGQLELNESRSRSPRSSAASRTRLRSSAERQGPRSARRAAARGSPRDARRRHKTGPDPDQSRGERDQVHRCRAGSRFRSRRSTAPPNRFAFASPCATPGSASRRSKSASCSIRSSRPSGRPTGSSGGRASDSRSASGSSG